MRYKLLGKSGLRVSELCLGTMTFGEDWGWGATKEESRAMFEAFAKAGGNFVDTANLYTNGTSEKYVGEFIAPDREHIVLATKYSLRLRYDDPNAGGNHRKNMVQSLNASLKRLNTDYIDLFWVHAWDFMTPVEEVMRGLDDLVRAGKILYVGISDTPAWIVSQANVLAELKGWTPFVGLQIQYSLVERTPERDLMPMARAMDIAVTPWGILGSGILTGKFKGAKDRPAGTRLGETEWGETFITERNIRIAEAVGRVAGETGASASQVAIAWLLRRPYGVVVPILGARKLSQLQDNLGSVAVKLSDDQIRRLDEVSRIDLGFPHDFLAGPQIRKVLHGDTYALVDNHRCG